MGTDQMATIYSDVNTFDQTTYSKRSSTLQSDNEHLKVVTIAQPSEKSTEKDISYPSGNPSEESIPTE